MKNKLQENRYSTTFEVDPFKLYFVMSQCVLRSGAATCGHKKTAQPFGLAASLFAVFNTVRFSTTLWRPHGDSNPGSWNENPMS